MSWSTKWRQDYKSVHSPGGGVWNSGTAGWGTAVIADCSVAHQNEQGQMSYYMCYFALFCNYKKSKVQTSPGPRLAYFTRV